MLRITWRCRRALRKRVSAKFAVLRWFSRGGVDNKEIRAGPRWPGRGPRRRGQRCGAAVVARPERECAPGAAWRGGCVWFLGLLYRRLYYHGLYRLRNASRLGDDSRRTLNSHLSMSCNEGVSGMTQVVVSASINQAQWGGALSLTASAWRERSALPELRQQWRRCD